LNDRDQFLVPDNKWGKDFEFQNNCLVFTLFCNNIQSKQGINYWIPYTEQEVDAKDKFESNFMTDFIKGKLIQDDNDLFDNQSKRTSHLIFSSDAKKLLSTGKKIWGYYHKQPNCNANASLYDIKEYFKGRNENGRMNSQSEDNNFMKLNSELRDNIKILSKKIEPKIYEYGFLKK
jgi:hypothetical protein